MKCIRWESEDFVKGDRKKVWGGADEISTSHRHLISAGKLVAGGEERYLLVGRE
jgi:hypothetical protein